MLNSELDHDIMPLSDSVSANISSSHPSMERTICQNSDNEQAVREGSSFVEGLTLHAQEAGNVILWRNAVFCSEAWEFRRCDAGSIVLSVERELCTRDQESKQRSENVIQRYHLCPDIKNAYENGAGMVTNGPVHIASDSRLHFDFPPEGNENNANNCESAMGSTMYTEETDSEDAHCVHNNLNDPVTSSHEDSEFLSDVGRNLTLHNNEAKIRAELELEIEKDLETEIKTKIALLNSKLDQLHLLQARRLSKDQQGIQAKIPESQHESLATKSDAESSMTNTTGTRSSIVLKDNMRCPPAGISHLPKALEHHKTTLDPHRGRRTRAKNLIFPHPQEERPANGDLELERNIYFSYDSNPVKCWNRLASDNSTAMLVKKKEIKRSEVAVTGKHLDHKKSYEAQSRVAGIKEKPVVSSEIASAAATSPKSIAATLSSRFKPGSTNSKRNGNSSVGGTILTAMTKSTGFNKANPVKPSSARAASTLFAACKKLDVMDNLPDSEAPAPDSTVGNCDASITLEKMAGSNALRPAAMTSRNDMPKFRCATSNKLQNPHIRSIRSPMEGSRNAVSVGSPLSKRGQISVGSKAKDVSDIKTFQHQGKQSTSVIAKLWPSRRRVA